MNAPHLAPDRRSMPVSAWPAADREIWHAALVPGDLLDEGGARAGYTEATNSMVAAGYGHWLTWLSRRGQLDPEASSAERIQPQTVAAWVAEMQHRGRASNTILTRLQALHGMAKVLDSGRDWRWLRRIEARVHAGHVPARSKRDRLVGSADLLESGVQLMDGAPALTTDRLRALQFRDGLIIALLAARPLRLRNLANLELERTLVARGNGWWIDIPGEETKTGQPIDVPWPAALNAALATYLAVYRPILGRLRNRWTRPVGHALWVSTHGSPMGYFALADTIEKRTRTAFGRSVNPNLFRDCAATSIAIEDPAHVRIASQILGHRSVATTERYYNQAQTIDAARQYQDFVVGLRNGRMTEDPGLKES
jgi:site-specific recombinase XerD